jgi:phosphoribosylformylglycinamidine synthase subunit PurQ / glutaminase
VTAPLALVIGAPGTNRDRDAAFALERAGASVQIASVARLADEPHWFDRAALAVVAGGFSHADALGAGRRFALDLQLRLDDALPRFVAQGKPVIGICNGFQSLVRAGLLPGALGHNAGGGFQCDWVTLEPASERCIWTAGIDPFDCPIAHGEGRYVHPDPAALRADGLVALRYAGRRGNPNGSVDDIAGVCDPTGLVLGLMPHPENHAVARQHPDHHRAPASRPLGLQVFERGVLAAGGVRR